jgi:hypothetical protein
MVVTIISGLIAAAAAITTGVMNNNATKEAGKEQKELAFIARDDKLKQDEVSNEQNQQAVGIQKDSLALKSKELGYNIQKDKKATRQAQLSTLGSALDNVSKKDQNQTNFIMSLYGKSASAPQRTV